MTLSDDDVYAANTLAVEQVTPHANGSLNLTDGYDDPLPAVSWTVIEIDQIFTRSG